jgi:hypothetical protein
MTRLRIRHPRPFLAAFALLAMLAVPSHAAPGDVVVPAHRTRDGQWVPANVPPVSGGTHVTRRPARGSAAHQPASAAHSGQLLPPLLVEAESIRR